jgi:hypothetical protein
MIAAMLFVLTAGSGEDGWDGSLEPRSEESLFLMISSTASTIV